MAEPTATRARPRERQRPADNAPHCNRGGGGAPASKFPPGCGPKAPPGAVGALNAPPGPLAAGGGAPSSPPSASICERISASDCAWAGTAKPTNTSAKSANKPVITRCPHAKSASLTASLKRSRTIGQCAAAASARRDTASRRLRRPMLTCRRLRPPEQSQRRITSGAT